MQPPATIAALCAAMEAGRTVAKPDTYASRIHVIFNHAGDDERAVAAAAWDEVSRFPAGGSIWWDTLPTIGPGGTLRGRATLTYED